MQIEFHWAAVALASLAGWILYVLWFSPYAFGAPWQRLEQRSQEGLKADLMARLALGLFVSAAQALCLEGFFNFTQSNTFAQGALAGLQLAGCLALPAGLLILVMGRRKAGLIGIYLGWILLSQILEGGLLAAWN